MEQNEQKSVWLKLILPICLGIFATAIYRNAIKSQIVSAQGFVAQQEIPANTRVKSEKDWDNFFRPSDVVFHSETPESIRDEFCFEKPTFPLKIRTKIKVEETVSKASFEK